jgi:hypothetical protein
VRDGFIELATSLDAYFAERLGEALHRESLHLEVESFRYLLHLLASFSHRGNLFRECDADDAGPPALADLFARAREANPSEQRQAYQRLGDMALFVGGFFGPYVHRRKSLVNIDYYVEMGKTGYGQAATFARRTQTESLLRELSEKFRGVTEVFASMADECLRTGRNPSFLEMCKSLMSNSSDLGAKNGFELMMPKEVIKA